MVHPIIYRVFYISGGFLAGFLNQQYHGSQTAPSSSIIHQSIQATSKQRLQKTGSDGIPTLGAVPVDWLENPPWMSEDVFPFWKWGDFPAISKILVGAVIFCDSLI